MNSEYSIELQAEKIDNIKTKEYFNEVLSSYINKNYRSAIVVLWTVTIYDLICKLQDLHIIFDDTTAEKILKEITRLQDENKTSPQWETKLIDLIYDRTNILETYEFTHIQSLQQHRHLSAHPIIKDDLELYQPNKETTRAYIRNILEAVLTKPSLASNKIFNILIKDISDKKDLFPNKESLKKYLEASFLKNTTTSTIQSIYKKLWKFCFFLNDEISINNKYINVRVLAIIFENNKTLLSDYMKIEEEYFGKNVRLDDETDLEYFILLCNRYPSVYYSLSDIFKTPIKEKIKQKKLYHTQSIFLYLTPSEYLTELKNNIGFSELTKNKDIIQSVKEYCKDNSSFNEMINMFIYAFKQSSGFSTADIRFTNLIEPFLKDMTETMLIELITIIDNDYQLYGRNQALYDNRIVKDMCDLILCEDFEYTDYPNFIDNIREES